MPTPPPPGAKMFERSRPSYKPIGEIGWCRRRRKILVPHLKGLGETVNHVFILKMLNFFWAFSLGPQESRICAATSDFVATPIFPPMGSNGDKCRLLLVEDPALKAQPWHEVAVGVFGPSPPVMDCTWAPPMAQPPPPPPPDYGVRVAIFSGPKTGPQGGPGRGSLT